MGKGTYFLCKSFGIITNQNPCKILLTKTDRIYPGTVHNSANAAYKI